MAAQWVFVFIATSTALLAQTFDWYMKAPFPIAAENSSAAEIRPLLQAACSGTVSGLECSRCPMQSSQSAEESKWRLGAVTLGHFTSAAADDALLSIVGCEPHSMHWGGSILLTRGADSWRFVAYVPGLISEKCHRLATRSGSQVLLCAQALGSGGTIQFDLRAADFRRPSTPKVHVVFEAWNEMHSCGQHGESGNPPVRQSVVDKVTFPDLNGDGFPDVLVDARTGMAQRTEAEYRLCQSRGTAWIPAIRVPRKTFQLLIR